MSKYVKFDRRVEAFKVTDEWFEGEIPEEIKKYVTVEKDTKRIILTTPGEEPVNSDDWIVMEDGRARRYSHVRFVSYFEPYEKANVRDRRTYNLCQSAIDLADQITIQTNSLSDNILTDDLDFGAFFAAVREYEKTSDCGDKDGSR